MDVNKIAKAIKNKVREITRDISDSILSKLKNKPKPEKRKYTVNAVIDSRTCPICRSKHNTEIIIRSTDSVEAIAGRLNSLPPFHIRCRCMLDAN